MNSSTTTRPSLETLVGLYRAALAQHAAAEIALTRVVESAERHGYTEKEIVEAAVR
jgi:hypothetical protein